MQTKSESDLWGIDVSHYQGLINWPKVAAAGVQFVYIKASDGLGYTDPQFRRNSGGANAVGIPAGYYHFGHPESNSAVAEAEAFCDIVNGLPYQLPHCLDLEGADAAALSTDDLTTWALTWMRTVKKLTGGRVMLYTGAYFARDELGVAAGEFPIWVAQYGAATPLANGTWQEWAAFQYTDGGTVAGIDGKVDMDYMDIDFWNEIMKPLKAKEGPDNMPMQLEDWQWDMLYTVMGKAYNVDQLTWDWMQKIKDKTLTAAELAFLNTVLDGRIDRKIEV